MKSKSDIELVELVQASDESAYKAIYDRYFDSLYQYFCYRTTNPDLAQEMVQELFIRLWKNRKGLRTQKTLKPYLFRIANNLLIDYFRKLKVRRIFQKRKRESSPTQYSEDMVTKIQIKNALEKLSEKYRNVFTLHHIERFTYKEIAVIENVSRKTVENRMKKAIFQLQKELKDLI